MYMTVETNYNIISVQNYYIFMMVLSCRVQIHYKSKKEKSETEFERNCQQETQETQET